MPGWGYILATEVGNFFNKYIMSILKFFLFTLFILGTTTVKSQSFLNKDSAQIKTELLSKGGNLRINALENGAEFPGYYHILIFKFSKFAIEKEGIHLMTLFLTTKNKCFAYIVSYTDERYIGKLKEAFNNPHSGLKMAKSGLKWVNPDKKYVITILPRIPVNGKIAPGFELKIKNDR